MNKEKISGAEILMRSLINEGVETIFGYPGGSIMPVFDALYDHAEDFHGVLVRHEQGAVHAAQGYARSSGKVGVCIVTSGPGATNTLTGISDAILDSTPVVVIAGQVSTSVLGTDAFQEIDFVGITQPITKWSYQIRRPEDIPWAVARAFYIAGTGRPGPVVLDFNKDAQVAMTEYIPQVVESVRSYIPYPAPSKEAIARAEQVGLATIVCADSVEEIKQIAMLRTSFCPCWARSGTGRCYRGTQRVYREGRNSGCAYNAWPFGPPE